MFAKIVVIFDILFDFTDVDILHVDGLLSIAFNTTVGMLSYLRKHCW